MSQPNTNILSNQAIADLRRDYRQSHLLETEVANNPFEQFSLWLSQAQAAGVPEPNAMTLATVVDNRPSARIVLLKGLDTGFCFYTNYESRKGRELKLNPNAALVFLWHELERQVRIEGLVEKVEPSISDAYYSSRPLASQIGAWSSPQSEVIASRQTLEDSEAQYATKFKDQPIGRPEHWGGYRLVPTMMEFWQGRRSRLHDRLRFTRANVAVDQGKNEWTIERLAP
jgi:pyridoxamine 5'-phosphate oxidase